MYHALIEGCPQYKWLKYRKLAELIVGPQDSIQSIVYFTAFTTWKPKSVARHMEYIKALRTAGVEVVRGRFSRRQKQCHKCEQFYWTHEEKRSDVNIAVRLLADAVRDTFDRAVLVSADSDLAPVVESVHGVAPGKEIGVMFPIGRSSVDLRQVADFRRKMRPKMLLASQFPDVIDLGDDRVRKPTGW